MRWLLVKDLRILRRSPLILGLLIAYPVAIGILIGLAISADQGKPRVAFLNLVPEDEGLHLGGRAAGLDRAQVRAELCSRVECVDVESRQQAEEMVADGDVLGALILPPDLLDQLESLTSLNPEQPTVEVLVNEDEPVKAQLVDDRIQALVTEANLILSQRISEQATRYLDLLTRGGQFQIPLLGRIDILGLARAGRILTAVERQLPRASPAREALSQVTRFADLARENLDFALPLLGAVAAPIAVDKEVIAGDTSTLDVFAVAVAAAVTLMFVTVLLVAGSLALEREENAFSRITRSAVGRTALLVEKLVLGVLVALVVTLLMLAALTFFATVEWERAAAIVAAIVAGGAAFAAFGAAIGGLAKEVRASSLLAFMVALPVAFLSLIPSGTVPGGAYDVIEVVRALFPFSPALDALEGALDPAGPALWLALVHLAAVIVAYGILARLALRRFA